MISNNMPEKLKVQIYREMYSAYLSTGLSALAETANLKSTAA